jgi:dihydroneopterin aldolase
MNKIKALTFGVFSERHTFYKVMKIQSSHIFLQDMTFFARHGVGNQEFAVGNEFRVQLRLKVDFSAAARNDELSGTVSYADVYQSVKSEMDIPSKLLEHVSLRIVRRLFADYPLIDEVEIKLSKRNPPMGADIDCAGVEMHVSRND